MSALQTKLNPETLVSALKWRYATKAFDSTKKIPEAEWKALEQSLVLSPSSYGLQPWKFLVIQSPELRKTLLPHSWGQKQVVDCSHYVVLAIKKELKESDLDRFIKRVKEVQNRDDETLSKYKGFMQGDLIKGPRNQFIRHWAIYQTYIALGFLMESAAVLGIDACPMEGIVPPKYDEVLGLDKTEYTTAVACALGYRSSQDKYASLPKVRYKTNEVVEYR